MGHGMIQVSPELVFSAFTPDNGYEIQDVVLYLDPSHGLGKAHLARWYRVKSPSMAGRRVGGITRCPAYLLVRARRVADIQPFTTWPQQTDYLAAWTESGLKASSNASSPPSRLIRAIRAGFGRIRKLATSVLKAVNESIFSQSDVFQPIDP